MCTSPRNEWSDLRHDLRTMMTDVIESLSIMRDDLNRGGERSGRGSSLGVPYFAEILGCAADLSGNQNPSSPMLVPTDGASVQLHPFART